MKHLDESYRYLAARCIEPLLHALARQLDGSRLAEDVECVHQARVVSRRLRSALRMFGGCFPPKKFKRWRNAVRDLTRHLGEARDLDVQVLFLESCVGALGPEERRMLRPGLVRLLLRLRQRREKTQSHVVKAIDAFERSGVLEELHAEAASTKFALERRQPAFGSAYVYDQAAKHVDERLTELLPLQDALADIAAADRHHKLRIAAKRLRYTLEICDPAFDGALDAYVKHAKKLQTLLGELHDCDVWAEQLDAFVEEERERTLAYFGHIRPFSVLLPGIDYLRAERKSAHDQLFREAAAYWAALEGDDVWGALRRLVHARAETAMQLEETRPDESGSETSAQVQHPDEDYANDGSVAGGRAWEPAGPRESAE